MAKQLPFTWNPTDIVRISNTSNENLILQLASGPLRLDIGVARRITASALDQQSIKSLVDAGKLSVETSRR